MDEFIGKWERVSMENAQPMLDLLGIPAEMQETMINACPVTTLERLSETEWKETEQMGEYSSVSTLELGKEKIEKTPTGDSITYYLEWDGKQMVGYMDFANKGVRAQVSRRVEGDKQIMSMTVGDQTSTQTYKRV